MKYISSIIYENKKIIFIKNLKKRTVFKNIEKEQLKNYITKIKAFNKDTTIYSINYNETEKTLKITANKKIQIYRKINKNLTNFKNVEEIKQEIAKLYTQNNIEDEEYISLNNIKILFNIILTQLFELKDRQEYNMGKKLIPIYGTMSDIVLYNYDRINNTIKIGFTKDYKNRKYKPVTFKKENNKISILKSETKEDLLLLKNLYNELNNLFEIYERFNKLDKEYNCHIRSVNANFYIDINLYNITLYSKNGNDNDFEIRYSTYEDKYYISGNENLGNYLNNISFDLLNLLYIPIIKCPNWCQDELYRIRDKELNINKQIYKIKRYRK